jgi:hypothetical protein
MCWLRRLMLRLGGDFLVEAEVLFDCRDALKCVALERARGSAHLLSDLAATSMRI